MRKRRSLIIESDSDDDERSHRPVNRLRRSHVEDLTVSQRQPRSVIEISDEDENDDESVHLEETDPIHWDDDDGPIDDKDHGALLLGLPVELRLGILRNILRASSPVERDDIRATRERVEPLRTAFGRSGRPFFENALNEVARFRVDRQAPCNPLGWDLEGRALPVEQWCQFPVKQLLREISGPQATLGFQFLVQRLNEPWAPSRRHGLVPPPGPVDLSFIYSRQAIPNSMMTDQGFRPLDDPSLSLACPCVTLHFPQHPHFDINDPKPPAEWTRRLDTAARQISVRDLIDAFNQFYALPLNGDDVANTIPRRGHSRGEHFATVATRHSRQEGQNVPEFQEKLRQCFIVMWRDSETQMVHIRFVFVRHGDHAQQRIEGNIASEWLFPTNDGAAALWRKFIDNIYQMPLFPKTRLSESPQATLETHHHRATKVQGYALQFDRTVTLHPLERPFLRWGPPINSRISSPEARTAVMMEHLTNPHIDDRLYVPPPPGEEENVMVLSLDGELNSLEGHLRSQLTTPPFPLAFAFGGIDRDSRSRRRSSISTIAGAQPMSPGRQEWMLFAA